MTRKLQVAQKWDVLEITTSTGADIRVERADITERAVRLATSYTGWGCMEPTSWLFNPQALRELAQICNEIADNLEYRK